jgi:isopentenyl-diphosphate Delta-isomerase
MELLDVINYEGHVTHTTTRDEVHTAGLRHRAVNVIAFLPDGRMVCQERHHTKKVNPGQIITFVSGHVQSGLTPIDAAIEEVFEESGLKVEEKDLDFIGITHFDVSHENGLVDDEYVYLFALRVHNLEDLVPEENEVEQFTALELSEISAGKTNIAPNLKELSWVRLFYKAKETLDKKETKKTKITRRTKIVV